MKYEIFYMNYKNDEEVSSDESQLMTKEEIIKKIELLHDHDHNFFGINDSDNNTIQFAVAPESKIWVEIPCPKENGAYGIHMQYEEVIKTINDLNVSIKREDFPNFEFDSYHKPIDTTNDPWAELENEKKWWQFWK